MRMLRCMLAIMMYIYHVHDRMMHTLQRLIFIVLSLHILFAALCWKVLCNKCFVDQLTITASAFRNRTKHAYCDRTAYAMHNLGITTHGLRFGMPHGGSSAILCLSFKHCLLNAVQVVLLKACTPWHATTWLTLVTL